MPRRDDKFTESVSPVRDEGRKRKCSSELTKYSPATSWMLERVIWLITKLENEIVG
jgi:hypothetical protein